MCGFLIGETPPDLEKKTVHAILPAVLTLKAASGQVMKILRFIRFDSQLGDVTHPVEARVISSLRPDDILLYNSVMFLFGAKPGLKNRCITFHSSETTIPAVHRIDSSTTGSSISPAGVTSVSVAYVHADFEAIPACLKSCFYLPAGTDASVVVFTDDPGYGRGVPVWAFNFSG